MKSWNDNVLNMAADILDLIEFGKPRRTMTVEDWLKVNKIKDSDALEYDNARTAREILASPLYKALK